MEANPFSLMYHTEVVLPYELIVPSQRVSLNELIPEEERRVLLMVELDTLDEKHLRALEHSKSYQD